MCRDCLTDPEEVTEQAQDVAPPLAKMVKMAKMVNFPLLTMVNFASGTCLVYIVFLVTITWQ